MLEKPLPKDCMKHFRVCEVWTTPSLEKEQELLYRCEFYERCRQERD